VKGCRNRKNEKGVDELRKESERYEEGEKEACHDRNTCDRRQYLRMLGDFVFVVVSCYYEKSRLGVPLEMFHIIVGFGPRRQRKKWTEGDRRGANSMVLSLKFYPVFQIRGRITSPL